MMFPSTNYLESIGNFITIYILIKLKMSTNDIAKDSTPKSSFNVLDFFFNHFHIIGPIK